MAVTSKAKDRVKPKKRASRKMKPKKRSAKAYSRKGKVQTPEEEGE